MMPDWKDVTTYDFTKDLDQAGWAWEFLRRNQTYRADWERYKREGWESWGEDPQAFYSYIADKYKVIKLQDPADEKPGLVFGIPKKLIGYNAARHQFIEGQGGTNIYSARPQLVSIPEGQVAVTFDMTRPLTPQFEDIKIALIDNQRSRKFKRLTLYRDKWVLYLRVLDAKLLNETYHAIARVFHEETGDPQYKDDYVYGNTGSHKIRDIYKKQALPLVEGGYRYIL